MVPAGGPKLGEDLRVVLKKNWVAEGKDMATPPPPAPWKAEREGREESN